MSDGLADGEPGCGGCGAGMRLEGEGEAGLGERQAAVGARVRALRRAAGLTQTELAGGRFSKEYVSQIERGKTRPTTATLEWLAGRLGADRAYLEEGVAAHERERADAIAATAESLLGAHRYDDAIELFRELRELSPGSLPGHRLRSFTGEAWAQLRQGDLGAAEALLDEAADLTSRPGFTEVDRADVIFRLGVCRYSSAGVSEAIQMFDTALRLAEASDQPSDRLRSDIHQWRSRCFRRARDWEAAREDIERALELAEGRSDVRQEADAHFQASLVAEREGRWVLARTHAERAKDLFAQLGDTGTVARLLNNIAGLDHLLGNSERAVELLREAFAMFVDLGLEAEAGYTLCSAAEVHFDVGAFDRAEGEARKALGLLGRREDHLAEVGTAELVLGRSLVEQGRYAEGTEYIASAEEAFETVASVGHRAVAWIARGDVAERAGDLREASRLYRQAAQALQPAPS